MSNFDVLEEKISKTSKNIPSSKNYGRLKGGRRKGSPKYATELRAFECSTAINFANSASTAATSERGGIS